MACTDSIEPSNAFNAATAASTVARSPTTMKNVALLLRAILEGSLLRRESRGSFFRKDFPDQDDQNWISAAAYPIMYTGRVAGCFLISSTQQNFFLSQTRLSLIQDFTDLLALAIEPEDFYDPGDIQLGIMPDHTIQKKYFANFRDRVTTAMIMGTKEKRTLNSLEAEEYVWRQLETELLQAGAGEIS